MLSVTVICRNEEDNIRGCLESIKWADEIIIVDSFSTDKTVSIAKEYTDKIFQKEWSGFAKQREFALSKAGEDWVFPLDADERCSHGLKEEIISAINSEDDCSGYRIPRKTFVLNRWIKHGGWYPGYQTRLFLRKKASVTDRLIHEGYEVSGKTGYFKNDILHYTVTSISGYIRKINNYSSLQAVEKSEKKKVKLTDILFRPVATFIQQYFFRKSFLDGVQGLMVANFDVITNMLTYMKAWEIQHRTGKND